MTDVEGITNRLLDKGKTKEEIIKRLIQEYLTYKDLPEEETKQLAEAVYIEVMNARKKPKDALIKEVLGTPEAGVSMNEYGIGCRGEGDFYLHREIAKLIYSKGGILSPLDQDDAGAVRNLGEKGFIVCAVDGTHSRLSDYPFIAGFHVTRAALRDVYVKGAVPVALIDDLHLADDGDVGRLIDFLAGMSCVAELSQVPVIAGSTLRVGGDMVIGDRMVSCVAAVGVSQTLAARRNIKAGDVLLLTEGAGGGTIATTAIYTGNHDVVKETLNVDFTTACKAIYNAGLHKEIHAMVDVTNGGLRGDANEICTSTGLGLVFKEEKIEKLVNSRVLELLKKQGIDYLGVSLDMLLIAVPPEKKDEVMAAVSEVDVKIDEVGKVVDKPEKAVLETKEGETRDMKPLFRESAYTEIKKIVGEETPEKEKIYRKGIQESIREARRKKEKVVDHIQKSRKET